jgi:prophage antirepressor-like protein
MNELQTFKNEFFELAVKLDNGDFVFDAEHVAKCLGIVETKNNKEYVMWRRVNNYIKPFGTSAEENSPQVGKGDFIPEPLVYKLAFKASNELAEKFQDWLAIEVIPTIRKTGKYIPSSPVAKESFEMQLIGVEYATKILRVDETSKIKMLEVAHKQHGVPTNHLPAYVDEEVTKSLSTLLKENGIKLNTAKVNTRLIELGILEIKERPSSKGGTKEFKSLTEKGLEYGKNLLNPRNPKETQPHYYESKFLELVSVLEKTAI